MCVCCASSYGWERKHAQVGVYVLTRVWRPETNCGCPPQSPSSSFSLLNPDHMTRLVYLASLSLGIPCLLHQCGITGVYMSAGDRNTVLHMCTAKALPMEPVQQRWVGLSLNPFASTPNFPCSTAATAIIGADASNFCLANCHFPLLLCDLHRKDFLVFITEHHCSLL